MVMKTAPQLLADVKRQVTGAMQTFVIARLSLRCGIDLQRLPADDADPAKAQRLREAIQAVCPQVKVSS